MKRESDFPIEYWNELYVTVENAVGLLDSLTKPLEKISDNKRQIRPLMTKQLQGFSDEIWQKKEDKFFDICTEMNFRWYLTKYKVYRFFNIAIEKEYIFFQIRSIYFNRSQLSLQIWNWNMYIFIKILFTVCCNFRLQNKLRLANLHMHKIKIIIQTWQTKFLRTCGTIIEYFLNKKTWCFRR